MGNFFQNKKTNWKYIFIVLIFASLAGGGILWWIKTQEVPFTQLPEIKKPEKHAQKEKEPENIGQTKDVVQEFINSSYKVVSVKQNSFVPYLSLIIATERSDINDGSCGSIYTSRNCYFFLDPHFDYATRFVTKWQGNLDELLLDTIKFKDKENVEFESKGGDWPVGVHIIWNLNLKTGEIREINRQEFGPETE